MTTPSLAEKYADRHPGTVHLLGYLSSNHLPTVLAAVVRPCADLADTLVEALPDGPELTVGLRKLVEAKDCFVRVQVDALREQATPPPANTPEPFLDDQA